MENKFPRGKIALYMLCAAGALILLIISITSFGWFVTNKTSQSNMTGFRAVDLKFELGASDTVGLYDNYLISNNVTTKSTVKVNGADVDLYATGAGGSEIRWRMSSDSNFGNLSGDGIQPGSCGKLTFYVIAKQNTDLKLTFSLDTILYTADAKPISAEHPDNSAYIVPPTESAAKLVKGHILFFENCTDGVYSGRINGNTFERTITDAKADNAYKYDIYWIWPNVIDQLILPANDDYLVKSGYKKIISDADTAALITEISDKSGEYFGSEISDLGDKLNNIAMGSREVGSEENGVAAFNDEYYKALNTEWNSADNMIGRNVGYIELCLTADETAEAGT